MTKRLRFRREPQAKSLAVIWQGEYGCDLYYGEELLGGAYPRYDGFSRKLIGYYWYGHVGNHRENAASHPAATLAQAKAECMAWVRTRLKEKEG